VVLGHRRADPAQGDGIDAYAVPADLGGRRLHQLNHRGLGRAVTEQPGAFGVDRTRGHGDDAAQRGLRDHQADRLLAGVQHSLEVHVRDPVEVLVASLKDRLLCMIPAIAASTSKRSQEAMAWLSWARSATSRGGCGRCRRRS
jgi:hypothetical protein